MPGELSLDLLQECAKLVGGEMRPPRFVMDFEGKERDRNDLLDKIKDYPKRVRDFAQVKKDGKINEQTANEALELLEVDELGLDHVDRLYLKLLLDKFNGGPVGLNTISAALSEDMDTIEDVIEPFLLQLGFINRTSRGRVLAEAAYRHLGAEAPANLQDKLI
jgi:Holliday junction DNA helicase RuvB